MLNSIIVAAIFFSVFMPLPLIGLPGFKSGLYLYHLLAALCFTWLAWRFLIQSPLKLKKFPLFLLLIAPLISLIISLLGSGKIDEWIIPIISFFCFLSLYAFGLNCKILLKDILNAAPFFLAFSALLGCIHYLTPLNLYINPYVYESENIEELTGFLGLTRGSIGVVYSSISLLVIHSLLTKENQTSKIQIFISISSLILSFFCIIMSGSRTGLIAFIAAIIISITLGTNIRNLSRNSTYILFLFFLILIASLTIDIDSYINAERFSNSLSSDSLSDRLSSQLLAIQYILQNPIEFIFGQGYSTINYINKTGSLLTHPHNEFLQTIWALGFMGFLVFILFSFHSVKIIKKSKPKKLLLSLIIINYITATSVGGFFTPSLRLAFAGTFFFFLTGIIHREYSRTA